MTDPHPPGYCLYAEMEPAQEDQLLRNALALLHRFRYGRGPFGRLWVTANVPLAIKRGGKLLLGIGGNAAFNAVFGTDTDDVCNKLITTGYVPLNPRKRDLDRRAPETRGRRYHNLGGETHDRAGCRFD